MKKATIIKKIEDVHSDLYAKADFWFKRAQFALEQKLPDAETARSISNATAYDYAERLVGGILTEVMKK